MSDVTLQPWQTQETTSVIYKVASTKHFLSLLTHLTQLCPFSETLSPVSPFGPLQTMVHVPVLLLHSFPTSLITNITVLGSFNHTPASVIIATKTFSLTSTESETARSSHVL